MALINYIGKVVDLLFGTAWFLNFINLFGIINGVDLSGSMSNLGFVSTTTFQAVGIVWGCVRIYNSWHNGKIDRERKKEELRRYKHETDSLISNFKDKNKV